MNQDANLIFQQLISISLIAELHKNNFLESDFYKKMEFSNSSIKQYIDQVRIDNQGMLLIFLYSLLLTPKEKIFHIYKSEFDKLDDEIERIKIIENSTYSSDKKKTQYTRHIRNSVAHGKVEYNNNSIIFKDDYKGQLFFVEIPLDKIGYLLNKLQEILYKYIEYLKSIT